MANLELKLKVTEFNGNLSGTTHDQRMATSYAMGSGGTRTILILDSGLLDSDISTARFLRPNGFILLKVAIWVDQPLYTGFQLTIAEERTWIRFKYEQLQELYWFCGRLDHSVARCMFKGTSGKMLVYDIPEKGFGPWLRADAPELPVESLRASPQLPLSSVSKKRKREKPEKEKQIWVPMMKSVNPGIPSKPSSSGENSDGNCAKLVEQVQPPLLCVISNSKSTTEGDIMPRRESTFVAPQLELVHVTLPALTQLTNLCKMAMTILNISLLWETGEQKAEYDQECADQLVREQEELEAQNLAALDQAIGSRPTPTWNLYSSSTEKGSRGMPKAMADAMTCIAWNCQKAGQSLTIGVLRDLKNKYCPFMIFIMETKQSIRYLERIRRSSWWLSCIYAPPNRQDRGIFWNDVKNSDQVLNLGYLSEISTLFL
ncbi:hypothetical protein Tsubulata_035821 [Turnera subulata]|uniref:Zinc knuckle CX2CX4HX4C domain-containing protein n=1 Tax=Turnera subulata TaxID=218843 RepID=A0A9Q0JDG2_9ROSI|nr:hypothetical protein Tsubulata_035821 [Turnera subulata]